MNIEKVIDKRFIETKIINKSEIYEIKYINAMNLIDKNRIDLVAKYKFLESKVRKLNTCYYEKMYKATIEAFSEGKFEEPGNEKKNSFKKYVDSFLDLNENILENGFNENKSIIPIGKNNSIIDGAHRVAIMAYHNMKVPVIKTNNTEVLYDFNFFEKKLVDKKILDNLCLEYTKMKKDIYVICIWPILTTEQKNMAKEIIRNSLNVIYEKKVDFSYNGLHNFMVEIYGHQNWIGKPENNFVGVTSKADACYRENSSLECIIVEEKNLDKIINIKSKIRNIIKIGNHSIHSTDNIEETIQMLSIILNNNCIEFYNDAKFGKYPDVFNKIDKVIEKLKKEKISLDDVIVDSGTVMALYGLRNNEDVDLLINEKYNENITSKFDTHNDSINLYSKSLDDMLYNPENYFYFHKMKFLTLQQIKTMKEKRNEEKDKLDVKIISRFQKNEKKSIDLEYMILKVKRYARNVKRYFIEIIKKILIKVGIFENIKKIMKKR